jgi:hypothetical protein
MNALRTRASSSSGLTSGAGLAAKRSSRARIAAIALRGRELGRNDVAGSTLLMLTAASSDTGCPSNISAACVCSGDKSFTRYSIGPLYPIFRLPHFAVGLFHPESGGQFNKGTRVFYVVNSQRIPSGLRAFSRIARGRRSAPRCQRFFFSTTPPLATPGTTNNSRQDGR